jgi:hypothetical protein
MKKVASANLFTNMCVGEAKLKINPLFPKGDIDGLYKSKINSLCS